jgi:rod shape-determining protein MreC
MDFIKNKLLTIVLVLCLAFTIFVGITASRNGNTGTAQGVINSAIAPVQRYVYLAGQRISNIFYFVSSITSTRRENIELKGKVEELNQKIVDYDRYKRENEELNKLLSFKNAHSNIKVKGANVIGKVGENWFNLLIIDVGEADGVKKGQYVINGSGLVGRIMEVSGNTAKVITVVDDKANIPGKISSTGDTGMVSGIGSSSDGSECKLSYLPIDSTAKVGDPVVTSNIITDAENVVPSDILIGFIERIEDEEPKLIKAAYIKPVVNFSQLEKVLVIIK